MENNTEKSMKPKVSSLKVLTKLMELHQDLLKQIENSNLLETKMK